MVESDINIDWKWREEFYFQLNRSIYLKTFRNTIKLLLIHLAQNFSFHLTTIFYTPSHLTFQNAQFYRLN